ncbi:MAG: hypothetical protein ACRDYC_05625 [Acidimicrobiales bacterium]
MRPQVAATLGHYGWAAEGRPDSHGFEAERNETFITATGEDLEALDRVAIPLGWRLRAHWKQSVALNMGSI